MWMLVHHREPRMKRSRVLLLSSESPLAGDASQPYGNQHMKQLGVLLLSPGRAAGPSQDTQHETNWSR